ncbi:MAG: CotH kinase family protein [Flavobacteriales bacterium]|nr:CotH kinase family protein [Flavobacteriales bacterium]
MTTVLFGLVLLAAAFRPEPVLAPKADPTLVIRSFDPNGSPLAPSGAVVRYTLNGEVPGPVSPVWAASTMLRPDQPAIERILRTPSSPQWRSPELIDFPQRTLVLYRAFDADGRCGPVVARSFGSVLHAMPVLSIAVPEGALFDPDTGIYVMGHGVFHQEEEAVKRYPQYQRWWRYPGNYQFRGKAWERAAQVVWEETDGRTIWAGGARIRINGNNTRGFPQHALRLRLEEGSADDVSFFSPEHGTGHRTVVLRTGGNDQDKAFMRDALVHRMCEGLGFGTSAVRNCVVYVNGAYWGIHQLRERHDDQELARRAGCKAKEITVIADRGILAEGDQADLDAFMRALNELDLQVKAGVDPAPTLERFMDTDDLIAYLAAQVIISNTDWPEQNVKLWRYSGDPRPGVTACDGRWRMLMGDSDLSFGYPLGPEFNSIAHLRARKAPLSRLFRACLASPRLRERFVERVRTFQREGLSTERMLEQVAEMARELEPEMPMHIARWRRPLTVGHWKKQVEVLLAYASARNAAVTRHLNELVAERS